MKAYKIVVHEVDRDRVRVVRGILGECISEPSHATVAYANALSFVPDATHWAAQDEPKRVRSILRDALNALYSGALPACCQAGCQPGKTQPSPCRKPGLPQESKLTGNRPRATFMSSPPLRIHPSFAHDTWGAPDRCRTYGRATGRIRRAKALGDTWLISTMRARDLYRRLR